MEPLPPRALQMMASDLPLVKFICLPFAVDRVPHSTRSSVPTAVLPIRSGKGAPGDLSGSEKTWRGYRKPLSLWPHVGLLGRRKRSLGGERRARVRRGLRVPEVALVPVDASGFVLEPRLPHLRNVVGIHR